MLLALPGWAGAGVTGGGRRASVDCLAVFDAPPVNVPTRRPRHVRCTDGDAACDADGAINGRCEFPVAVCINSTFAPLCTLNGVQSVTVAHALDNGDPQFDPDFQALQTRIDNEFELPITTADQCTTPTTFVVPIEGPSGGGVCRRDRKQIKMDAESTLIGTERQRDRNRLKLICDPAPTGCDPHVLFAGTYDRIQQQIFSARCAVSGCHDSETLAGGMLLEVAGSYSNLVGVTPTNPAAAAAGWKRVTVLGPTSGDPATSLLFHKLNGDLPPGFGAQMPFGGRPLKGFLVDIVELWIAAGAPQTGWVPGTD